MTMRVLGMKLDAKTDLTAVLNADLKVKALVQILLVCAIVFIVGEEGALAMQREPIGMDHEAIAKNPSLRGVYYGRPGCRTEQQRSNVFAAKEKATQHTNDHRPAEEVFGKSTDIRWVDEVPLSKR